MTALIFFGGGSGLSAHSTAQSSSTARLSRSVAVARSLRRHGRRVRNRTLKAMQPRIEPA